MTTKFATANRVQYRVVAQLYDNQLNIEDLSNGSFFTMPAHRIACNLELLRNFSAKDACLIGFISNNV